VGGGKLYENTHTHERRERYGEGERNSPCRHSITQFHHIYSCIKGRQVTHHRVVSQPLVGIKDTRLGGYFGWKGEFTSLCSMARERPDRNHWAFQLAVVFLEFVFKAGDGERFTGAGVGVVGNSRI
jgi:hypothetical protein